MVIPAGELLYLEIFDYHLFRQLMKLPNSEIDAV